MTGSRPIRRGFILASTALLWLSTAIGATSFWPVYQSAEFVIMVSVTTVVASLIAIAGAVYRLPAHVIVLAGLLAYVVLGVPLAVPDKALYGVIPTLGGLADLGRGTALSWKQLLTITLPVGSYQALLVPAFIVVLVTVITAQSIALRARFGELAVLGPITLFLVGTMFGATTAFFPLAISLSLTAVLLLWLIWFRWYRRRDSVRRSARRSESVPASAAEKPALLALRTSASGALIILIASAGATGAVAIAPPAGEREVLRSSIVQPFDPRDYQSPLSGFRHYFQPPNDTSEMLTVDGLPDGARIRIATLDSYDGIVYSVGSDAVSSDSGTFTLVPYEFDQSAVEGTPVSLDVRVGAYSGVWLPTVGKLEQIGFYGESDLRESFYYNDNTGSAAVVEELGEGDRYRLSAVLPAAPDGNELATLTPGDAQLPTLGTLPDELSVALDRYVDGVEGDGARLRAAMTGLREEGYISHGVSDEEPVSRSGHSADRISQLFSAPQMIGDGEQYAVAAALMARELGFPARVVVGFVPDDIEPDGSTVVTGADISAWIEVDTTQFGWVTIDPIPPVRDIPEEEQEEPAQIARPQSPVPPPFDDTEVPEEQSPPEVAQDEAEAVDPLLAVLALALRIAGWALLAAAIILSPFAAIVAAKMRRRRLRRTVGTPLERISGGWREFEDAVLDHGFTPPDSPTRSELAGIVGGVQPLVLAAAADRAVFAPRGPEPSDVDHVWRAVDELRSSLDDGLTRRQRLRARVSLRSLNGRRTARPTPGSRSAR